MQSPAFSVTELNNRIKDLLELDPLLENVCVRGELSNYKIYPSGHHYFTLKDSQSSLKCVMFKSAAMKLRFRPDNGMGVTVWGRISVYPRDGIYQLYCTSIMPEGTGDLQLAYEQLKQKLSEEGLFDAQYKKPLPEFPERIAIITSEAGAAVHDMIRILSHRWPMTKLLLLPVRVQGVEAPAEIAGAIRYANAHRLADLIITGRGGGSIEDLWGFNEEIVARAIFECKTPIVSAVGHETDTTIADYVSDLRAPTPSAAAELTVFAIDDFERKLSDTAEKLSGILDSKISNERLRLNRAQMIVERLNPSYEIDNKRTHLIHMDERLRELMVKNLNSKKHTYELLIEQMKGISPLEKLSKGYSFVEKSGQPIKSVSDVKKDDVVTLYMKDGKLTTVVREIEHEHRE